MRNRAKNQYALGLGAAGAVAVLAASALAHAVAQRRRRSPYSKLEWEKELEETGEISNFHSIVDEIADRGLEPSIRPDVWPFLLDVFDPAAPFQERQMQHQLMVRQYQQLLLQCQAYEAALRESLKLASPSVAAGPVAAPGSQQQPQQPLPQQPQQQLPEQVRQFAEAHRLIVMDAVRIDFQKHSKALASLCSHHGCNNSSSVMQSSCNSITAAAAAAVNNFAASTGVSAVANAVSNGLASLQQLWLGSLLGGQAAAWGHQQALWVSEAAQLVLENSSHMVEESKRQACRVIAMLSAYALHDPDTGYCQGMSDLLLPFVLLMEDDVLAFWCFVALMQRRGLRRNFAADESGIFSQLKCLAQVLEACDRPLMFRLHQLGAAECHFAYRMVLVMMRRELSITKVMQLWEILWADARREQQRLNSMTAQPDTDTDNLKGVRTDATEKPAQLLANATIPGSNEQQRVEQKATAGKPDLFICIVAAVVIHHRRPVLDHCYDADDVLRLFHSMKHVDIWQCLIKAQELQEAVLQQSLQQPQQLEHASTSCHSSRNV